MVTHNMELILFAPLWVWLGALLLDRILAEPRFHPLTAFGDIATRLELAANRGSRKFRGLLSVAVLLTIPGFVVWYFESLIEIGWLRAVFDIGILWLAIGWHGMKQHARAVATPLMKGDLPSARSKLALIVSRDTGEMDATQVVGSTLESTIENGNDCLFASLFWYAVAGPAAVVIHRLSNTLDAMWGYKTDRYLEFGYAAARLDDVLGWAPARLTAVAYGLSGSFYDAWKSYRAIAGKHKSVNAGMVMASGAGALQVQFGGAVSYNGVNENKPLLGVGRSVEVVDIDNAIKLIHRSVAVWIFVYAFITCSIGYLG